jgi:hypothetical protein
MTASRMTGMFVAAALVTALMGCTSATPYQPQVAGQRVAGGYSEERLAEDRYRVNFAGNSLTSRDRVEGYLLYRAAELTVQAGYDWFLIIDRLTARESETYVDPDPFYDPWYGRGYGYWRPHWRYWRGGAWEVWHPEYGGRFWGDSVDIRTVERFEAHAEIVFRRGAVPAGEERAFDARRVMADLGPTLERPEPR